MDENHELRSGWRMRWLSSIKDFADEETQRRVWPDPANTNPHYSFVECFCCYFDDLDLSDDGYARALDEGLVSEAEVAAVADFHNFTDTYESPTDDYDHQAILMDANWTEVVALAKRAQAALLSLIEDPDERHMLGGP